MTDLEMTRLCAEAMGAVKFGPAMPGSKQYDWQAENGAWICNYDPLHNDAQAMALVKKFHLAINGDETSCEVVWFDPNRDDEFRIEREDTDLNRAICECVAKMKTLSTEPSNPDEAVSK